MLTQYVAYAIRPNEFFALVTTAGKPLERTDVDRRQSAVLGIDYLPVEFQYKK